MPYIDQGQRDRLDPAIHLLDLAIRRAQGRSLGQVGALNYAITRLLLGNLLEEPSYMQIAAAVGMLETCKLELYRKLAAPYEDDKAKTNGEVYP